MRHSDDERESSEHGELTAEAYHATVPSSLTGFRGIRNLGSLSRGQIIIASATLIAIIGGITLSCVHGSSAASAETAPISSQTPQPAAPGISAAGTTNQKPIVDDPTPLPTQMVYPQPITIQITPQPQQENVAASGQNQSNDSSQHVSSAMAIDGNLPTQDEQASQDIQRMQPRSRANSPDSALATPSSEFVTSRDIASLPAQAHERYAQDQEQSPAGYIHPQSKYQLDPTTVIPARLITKITSDLPGPVTAEVTVPIYDSATHTTLVIPPGTKLFGRYDSEIVQGQNRLLMSFQRLIFPNGVEFALGGEPAGDAQGAAGLSGDVDEHRGRLYSTASLLTVLSGASAALSPNTGSALSQPSIGAQMQAAAGAQLQQLGTRVLNQRLQQPPTIIIRPPYLFQVLVTKDLPLDAYHEDATS